MRPIDADDAIYELERVFPVEDFKKIVRAISRTPTADVVEVVRCKDCKHHDGKDGQCPVQSTGDPFYDYKPADNWYCGDGERRE